MPNNHSDRKQKSGKRVNYSAVVPQVPAKTQEELLTEFRSFKTDADADADALRDLEGSSAPGYASLIIASPTTTAPSLGIFSGYQVVSTVAATSEAGAAAVSPSDEAGAAAAAAPSTDAPANPSSSWCSIM